jgi:23S rRNA pseudouridine2457 synthase
LNYPFSLLIAFNKPWGVLCQFSDKSEADQRRPTLADFVSVPGVYPAGRLDRDSEGLLLLTDDGKLQNRIADPRHRSEKRYLVQVEGVPNAAQLSQLSAGVRLKDGLAHASDVELVPRQPSWLWRRDPPIRERKNIPVAWLALTLTEGRNRQVRRMTAAVGLPTLRLVRTSIGQCNLNGLEPGKWREESTRIFSKSA